MVDVRSSWTENCVSPVLAAETVCLFLYIDQCVKYIHIEYVPDCCKTTCSSFVVRKVDVVRAAGLSAHLSNFIAHLERSLATASRLIHHTVYRSFHRSSRQNGELLPIPNDPQCFEWRTVTRHKWRTKRTQPRHYDGILQIRHRIYSNSRQSPAGLSTLSHAVSLACWMSTGFKDWSQSFRWKMRDV